MSTNHYLTRSTFLWRWWYWIYFFLFFYWAKTQSLLTFIVMFSKNQRRPDYYNSLF